MNRERLTILRDHLASLPDERVRMENLITDPDGEDAGFTDTDGPEAFLAHCGTAACIAGWASALFPGWRRYASVLGAAEELALDGDQRHALFTPADYSLPGRYTRSDAIAAIQSMLDSPEDDALPVWPEARS